jgi:hypothetical protein
MKKITMILMATALVVLVACGGKKSDAAGGSAVKTEKESPAAAKSSSSVDKYLSLIEELIPLAEKMKKGDAAAIEKYTKLSQELSELASSTDFQSELAKLTPEQTKKYQEALLKFAAAAQ